MSSRWSLVEIGVKQVDDRQPRGLKNATIVSPLCSFSSRPLIP